MEFLSEHGLEIFTTVLGLIYLYYEYRASIWLWLLGIIMPMIDIYLFASNGLYAYAFISMVFVIVAFYGVLNWKFGGKGHRERQITHMNTKKIFRYILLTGFIFAPVYFVLVTYTDSEVPVMDSFTTAASFTGVIALAYKYVEQWLVWVIVDLISVVLFIHQGLPFRAALYGFYVFVAIQGYRKWKTMAVSFQ